jgi:hypothetical protein
VIHTRRSLGPDSESLLVPDSDTPVELHSIISFDISATSFTCVGHYVWTCLSVQQQRTLRVVSSSKGYVFSVSSSKIFLFVKACVVEQSIQ